MAEHEKRIREALEAGPTEGDWEAWTGGKSRYGVTGPSAAACHSAQQGVSDCQVTADLPCVQIASSGSKAPALAFGDNELEAKANARLIAACNPAAIRALLADLDAARAILALRPQAVPSFLQPADLQWLQRFKETTEDDQSYDVPKEAMKRLAELGAVRSEGFGRYSITAFGKHVTDPGCQFAQAPLMTQADHEAAYRKNSAHHGITAQGAQGEQG